MATLNNPFFARRPCTSSRARILRLRRHDVVVVAFLVNVVAIARERAYGVRTQAPGQWTLARCVRRRAPTDHAHAAAPPTRDGRQARHSRARATRSKNLICRKPFLYYNISSNLLLSTGPPCREKNESEV